MFQDSKTLCPFSLKAWTLSVLLVVMTMPSIGQQTQTFIDPERSYAEGLQLFDAKNYLSAREKFESIYRKAYSKFYNGNEVLCQNIDYYIAICAVETNDKDSEQLLTRYLRNYHETDKRRKIYFYLGKYYYRNARYAEAAEQLEKVNINDLTNEQIYDYKFILGYSFFIKKKFKEAKLLFAALTGIKEKYYYPANYYYAFINFFDKDYSQALKNFQDIEDSKMYASVIPYYIAQIYYFKNDYDKLIPYINSSIGKDGVLYKDEMKFLLGQVYFQKSDYAKALPLLDGFISKSQKVKKEDIYQLAYCLYQTGAYEKAIENFKQLNLLDDKMGQNATYALADCYLKTNQKDKARSAFQSVVNMRHDESIRENALYNYAKLSFELNYTSEAIQSFEDYLLNFEKGKYLDDVTEMLAAALVQTKNYDRAYRLMEKMKIQSPLIKEAYQKVTYYRAIELFNDHNLAESLRLCEKSLAYNVSTVIYALATYLKGEIYYEQQKYGDAISQYMKFSTLYNPSLVKQKEASKFRAAYNIGYCYFRQKKYGDAVIYFNNAIEELSTTSDTKGKESLSPDLYLRYADCLFVTKSYQKSLGAYSTIVANNWPAVEYAQYQKGVIYGLMDRDEEKIQALNTLINNYPASNYGAQAMYEIAETQLSRNDLDASRSSYRNLITKYPGNHLIPKSYLKIAVIDYNTAKKEQALEDYQTVVKQYSETNEAKEALDALKELYVELGRADEYFSFLKGNSNVTISNTEQDSLTYKSALVAYNKNDCPKAIALFNSYISNFPTGYFINEVLWKKAECHVSAKDFENAFVSYEGLIKNKYGKYYEQALLKASGIAYYEIKDFQKALTLYKQLYVASTSQQNTYTAMLGMLQSAAKLSLQNEVVEYADQLINSGMCKENDYQEAHYLKGKAYYAKNDPDFAMGAFNRVTEFPVNEKCVESKYMVARILFEKKSYKASLDTCNRLKNKYASYEYWMAKTFVLMADNFYALGNTFQAKATLESIVQNYEGNAELLNEAKTKLEKIRSEELAKSKIMQIAPSDTLMMESETIIGN